MAGEAAGANARTPGPRGRGVYAWTAEVNARLDPRICLLGDVPPSCVTEEDLVSSCGTIHVGDPPLDCSPPPASGYGFRPHEGRGGMPWTALHWHGLEVAAGVALALTVVAVIWF